MFRRATRKARDARGANLVEFAIVLVLLLLILGAIADLGRAFYTYIAMANAAREGARYGIRLPCLPSSGNQPQLMRQDILQAVQDEAVASGVDLEALECDIILKPDPVDSNCEYWLTKEGDRPLEVTVSCPYSTGMSSAPSLFGITGLGDFRMTAKATMAIFGNDTLP